MPTYTPADDLLGPVLAQLQTIAGQITGINRIYTDPIDGNPEHNSVIIDLNDPLFDQDDSTNTKNYVTFHLLVLHLFARRGRLQDTLATARTYIRPWLDALNDNDNQLLNGYAIGVTPKRCHLRRVLWGGEQYVGLEIELDVKTELNIL
jgi:hypothetical protein